VVIIAKAAMHRRAMMESGWSGPGGRGYGYGHHRFAGADDEMGQRAFRLPPRIEAAIEGHVLATTVLTGTYKRS